MYISIEINKRLAWRGGKGGCVWSCVVLKVVEVGWW